MPFDSVAFVSAVQERIIDPARHAAELLTTWPTLTRMVTTLSPHEMTLDPLFVEQPDLPDLDLSDEVGTINAFCDGARSFDLPDGRLLALPGMDWPEVESDVTPWATVIAEIPPVGAPQVTTDNADLVDELLQRFNEQHGARSPTGMQCDGTSEGEDGWNDSGVGPIDGSGTGPDQTRDDVCGGCGCSTGGGAPATLGLIVLVLGLVPRRRQAAAPGVRRARPAAAWTAVRSRATTAATPTTPASQSPRRWPAAKTPAAGTIPWACATARRAKTS